MAAGDHRMAEEMVPSVMLTRVKDLEVPVHWPKINLLLDIAPEYWADHYSKIQIYTGLLDGRFQFWYATKPGKKDPFLGGLTQVEQYGMKKTLRVWWVGGEDLSALISALPTVERWALSIGCDNMEVAGRAGWERVMAPHGFKRTHVVLTKELSHG